MTKDFVEKGKEFGVLGGGGDEGRVMINVPQEPIL